MVFIFGHALDIMLLTCSCRYKFWCSAISNFKNTPIYKMIKFIAFNIKTNKAFHGTRVHQHQRGKNP